MDIGVLRNFLLLAETLNFSRASEKAFIAQPALSRQIQQLEHSLDAVLFTRNKRNVELTPAGQYFRSECERLLRQFDHALQRTGRLHRGEAGEIRIGYTHSVMQSFLPPLIRRLKQAFPEIRSILLEFNTSRQQKALRDREIDIGFAPNPVIDNSLKSKVVARDNFAVVLPPDHPIDRHNFRSLADFREENFILTPRSEGPLYVSTIESLFVEAGFMPSSIHETPFASTGIKLVETGIGITIEPVSGVRGETGVKYIELDQAPQKVEIVMQWHPAFEAEFPGVLELLAGFEAKM